MVKYCVKCGGLLVQGTETCIICGKTIAHIDRTASKADAAPVSPSGQPADVCSTEVRFVTAPGGKSKAIPNYAPIPPFKPSGTLPGPQIRFVTAPGGRRVEGSSTAKSYQTR